MSNTISTKDISTQEKSTKSLDSIGDQINNIKHIINEAKQGNAGIIKNISSLFIKSFNCTI